MIALGMSLKEAELPMRQGGAAAPPTAGVAQQNPLHLPFRRAGKSGTAAAGGGGRRLQSQKQGEKNCARDNSVAQ